ELALFTSNDEGIAEVDKTGLVLTRNRGLTSIMIRYSGKVAAVRVAVPFHETIPDQQFPIRNFIDQEIAAELARLGIPASGLSEDAEFLRRVHLGLVGRLPDSERVRNFLKAPNGKDRNTIIEQLLTSDDFTDFWTLKFADLLLINGKRGSDKATAVYHHWLRDQLSQNTAWNRIAASLLTAEGDITESGPPNFYAL